MPAEHPIISVKIYFHHVFSIKETPIKYNKDYFKTRSLEKNALAISSMQSELIHSYDEVLKKYKKTFENDNLLECPKYWGGFSFKPYEIEFWEGSDFRLNKRNLYKLENACWNHFILQP